MFEFGHSGITPSCPPSASLTMHSVSRIALVSADRARQIEAMLLRLAQSGQLRGRVTEQQLIDLLEQVSYTLCDLHAYASSRSFPGGRCAK